MRNIFESLKILLLLIIAVLLFFPQYQKQTSVDKSENELTKVAVDEPENPIEEYTDLKRIMKHHVAKFFKFPESIKYKDIVFKAKKVFGSHGVNLPKSTQDIIIAKMGGVFSAANGLGNYGGYEPFYVEMAIDNFTKEIGGIAYFYNDGMLSKAEGSELDLLYSEEGSIFKIEKEDKEYFTKAYEVLCGPVNTRYLGRYRDYKTSYPQFAANSYDDKLGLMDKKGLEDYNKCISLDADRDACFFIVLCRNGKAEQAGFEECGVIDEVCMPDDDFKVCSQKIIETFEQKKKKEASK